MSLPTPKEITRASLETSDFDTEKFLVDHCQFRSLSDLRDVVHKWEKRLQTELETTVKENYSDLAGSYSHIHQAREDLTTVKLEVVQFKSQIARISGKLDESRAVAAQKLNEQRELREEEHKIKVLLDFCQKLDHLEQIPENPDDHQLVEFSRAYVGIKKVEHDLEGALLVQENTSRINDIRELLLKRLNTRLKQQPSLEVAVAKAWIL